ncbi:hypothetical protein DFH09DRAFT_1115644 [Mycena vulgaris]|nr:hypothetical protein DFH09DRAFT_1115644 [Mycena vulgaris]
MVIFRDFKLLLQGQAFGTALSPRRGGLSETVKDAMKATYQFFDPNWTNLRSDMAAERSIELVEDRIWYGSRLSTWTQQSLCYHCFRGVFGLGRPRPRERVHGSHANGSNEIITAPRISRRIGGRDNRWAFESWWVRAGRPVVTSVACVRAIYLGIIQRVQGGGHDDSPRARCIGMEGIRLFQAADRLDMVKDSTEATTWIRGIQVNDLERFREETAETTSEEDASSALPTESRGRELPYLDFFRAGQNNIRD